MTQITVEGNLLTGNFLKKKKTKELSPLLLLFVCISYNNSQFPINIKLLKVIVFSKLSK